MFLIIMFKAYHSIVSPEPKQVYLFAHVMSFQQIKCCETASHTLKKAFLNKDVTIFNLFKYFVMFWGSELWL